MENYTDIDFESHHLCSASTVAVRVIHSVDAFEISYFQSPFLAKGVCIALSIFQGSLLGYFGHTRSLHA